MRFKIKTKPNLTLDQQKTLVSLGCKAKPYISRADVCIFGATCSPEQEQTVRDLDYVVMVEPMPTYK